MAHFYLPDGTPFYQVPYAGKREGLRDATITDAKKAGAYPSVTAIIGIPAKPALEIWKTNQAILSALTWPNLEDALREFSTAEVLQMIRRDSQQQVKDAAARGTAVHDAIEAAYKGLAWLEIHRATVDAVVGLIYEHCGDQPWEAEKWFAHPLGFGGKIDLISDEWVIDFKTKDGDANDHKMYDEQLMQLVAYDVGLIPDPVLGPTRRKANVIVSRDIPGSVQFWEWPDDGDEQRRQWEMFKTLLRFWQLKNRYEP